jgi:hypothetical protein
MLLIRNINKPEAVLHIHRRSENDINLLREWYLEIPSTLSYGWTMDNVFGHPFYVRDSPFNVNAKTPEEYQKKREQRDREKTEEMRVFFDSMEHRTPELLVRIKRTNELAAQILERAKQPNSTISQNMAEFIQIRGFLVDIRYAENEAAEKTAFDKLMDFIDTSHDKQLWMDFVYEIGLNSIMNHKYFPPLKVENYKKLFAERFQIKPAKIVQ